MAFCPHCGNEISDNAKFCPKCGQSIGVAEDQGQAAGEQFQGQPAGEQQFQGQPAGEQFQGQLDQGAPMPAGAPYMAPTISATEILRRAIGVIMRKPIKLWGISLLVVFLSSLATLLGGPIPIIGISIGLVLEFGMAWVYLEGYRGREVKADQIFEGFYKFWPTLAGMGWKQIIMMLWFLVPVGLGFGIAGALGSALLGNIVSVLINSITSSGYNGMFDGFSSGMVYGYGAIAGVAIFVIIVGLVVGIVLYCIKYYAYLLVPYVLRDNIDRKPMDIAREADAMTKGFKGKIFLTDFLIVLLVLGINVVFGILGAIPYLGAIINFISSIVNIIIGLFTPLLYGLVHAAWYDQPSQ